MFNHHHYVLGDGNVQVPEHLNFGKYILDRMRTKTNEIAFENIITKEKLSYKDVTQYAVNLAASLLKLGVGKGDIVAVGAEKRNEFIPIVLAIVFTGATCTSYELNLGKASLKHRINLAQPNYFICSRKFLEKYDHTIKNYACKKQIFTMDDTFGKVTSIKDLVKEDVNVELFEPATVSGQTDVAIILYSSGTTGFSKGVQRTHLNCILKCMPDDFSDDSLNAVLIAGLGGWYYSFESNRVYKCLATGKKVLYSQEINSELILRSIDEYQINILYTQPTVLCFILKDEDFGKYNLESLKIIYTSLSPLQIKTFDEVKLRFPNLVNIIQGYGMTEIGDVTSEIWGHLGPKPGSVGRVAPGITLKISDVETRKTMGPYERGEICLKRPIYMKAYIGMELKNCFDEEDFFRTGDLGYYDEDKYFYIVGRLKEMINQGGCMVPPIELENILQFHSGVCEACVTGKPDPDYGEVPAAFVVKQAGSTVTEQELMDYIAEEVTPNRQLRGGVKFIEEMPRSPTGKILKIKLKDLYFSDSSSVAPEFFG